MSAVIDSSKEYHNDMLDKIKTFWEYVTHNKEPEDVCLRTSQTIKDNIPINGKTKRDVSKSNSFTEATNAYMMFEEMLRNLRVQKSCSKKR